MLRRILFSLFRVVWWLRGKGGAGHDDRTMRGNHNTVNPHYRYIQHSTRTAQHRTRHHPLLRFADLYAYPQHTRNPFGLEL